MNHGSSEAGDTQRKASAVDFASRRGVVIVPDAAEREAHENFLGRLDEVSGGQCLWRSFEEPDASAET